MKKFIILPDVTCDLCEEITTKFGLEDYIQGYVHFSDGRDLKTTLDWSNISRDDFYKSLSNKKIQVSTAPASPEDYYVFYKKYAEQGYDILAMSISSKISSTHNVVLGAAERIRKEFPECNIYCFDSMRMAGALGLLVIYALQLKKDGKSMDEIVAWLEENKHKVHQMGPIDDLIFVARRGRISMGKAIMGNFAGVKPMGDCNREGYVTVLTKAKGMNKALALTVEYAKATATDIENQYVLVSHSDRQAYAETLADMVKKELNPKAVFVSDVFSGSGTNVGPGMVGVYFLGAEISEDLAAEKATMEKLIQK